MNLIYFLLLILVFKELPINFRVVFVLYFFVGVTFESLILLCVFNTSAGHYSILLSLF